MLFGYQAADAVTMPDKALEPSLLAGIVFDASSEPMTPTHAVKKGTRYRARIARRQVLAIDWDVRPPPK